MIYSTYLGGNGNDQGNCIALDMSGNVYVVGSILSTNFPTTVNAFQTAKGGAQDGFVTKLNAGGTGLHYSTYGLVPPDRDNRKSQESLLGFKGFTPFWSLQAAIASNI